MNEYIFVYYADDKATNRNCRHDKEKNKSYKNSKVNNIWHTYSITTVKSTVFVW